MADLIGQSQYKDRIRGLVQGDDATPELWNGPLQDLINNDKFLNDTKLDKTEVATNGANKIPRLNAQGVGDFSITGQAASVADGSVTDTKIATAAVTTTKLADGAATDTKIGNRTINDNQAPMSNTGLLGALLNGLAYMIKAITGKSDWKTAPVKTIEQLNSEKANLNGGATFTNGHVVVDCGGSASECFIIARMDGGVSDEGGLVVDQGGPYRVRMTAQGSGADNGANNFNIKYEKAADKALAAKGKLNIQGFSQVKLGDLDVVSPNYLIRRSGKDANGIFTQVDYLRPDGTLAIRTNLTGAPDANGNYPTMTIKKYELDGSTLISNVSYPITYDGDGDYLNVG
ncbi:hypothetical protein [Brevibacillus thermoruber]|uniref:hypothetical protein n=1 Tax=Brevibacillus thermoruber TaxID=33942 RepID=UPI000555C068|nr:hypothetical protein [Brevibacillus thermoruber]